MKLLEEHVRIIFQGIGMGKGFLDKILKMQAIRTKTDK
jgi:hypothetical protein